MFFGMIIWCAKATSFRSLEAARILCAFAGSVTEGLASAISADLFFLHERGWWMGIYIFALNSGPTVGSIISGFLVQHAGWRWHLWVLLNHWNITDVAYCHRRGSECNFHVLFLSGNHILSKLC